MWGLRVIRVGVLMCGFLALSAGSGCCDCCQNLWMSGRAAPASEPDAKKAPSTQTNASREFWFKDGPPPERTNGGIY